MLLILSIILDLLCNFIRIVGFVLFMIYYNRQKIESKNNLSFNKKRVN